VLRSEIEECACFGPVTEEKQSEGGGSNHRVGVATGVGRIS
jgi:hypothetical protein